MASIPGILWYSTDIQMYKTPSLSLDFILVDETFMLIPKTSFFLKSKMLNN